MRLVSALYDSFYPFHDLDLFREFTVAQDAEFEFQAGDVLVVWGGADIPPSYYNKGRSSMSGAWLKPTRRDEVEWALMQKAKENNIPIIGICRGAQMLCALEGGHLYQHVTNHSGTHDVFTSDGHRFTTNSIHHQMMVPGNTKYELIGWTEPLASIYHDVDESGKDVVYRRGHQERDPEFIYYPDIKGFAIQWHPEMMPIKSTAGQYVLNFIDEKLQ